MTKPARIAILDAGGQYIDLVRKAVQRQGLPADVLPLSTASQTVEQDYSAIIISGSPASSHAEAAPQPDPAIWQSRLPLLGICYGMQAMAVAHGGAVAKNAIREDGRVTTKVDVTHPIFAGVKESFVGLFTHGDFVTRLPDGFAVLGSHSLADGSTAYSAIAKDNKIGVQFHPEVFDDTPEGYVVFQNFLQRIAGLQPDDGFRHSQLQQIIADKQQAIQTQVGSRHVIAFVSGGVDSSVAATLAAKVVPKDKLHAYYIDSGFMRDEDDMVIEALQAAGLPVTKVDAKQEFTNGTVEIDGRQAGPLVSSYDPEIKRKIIGKVFVDIQNRLVTDLKLTDVLLLQGTNAADRIESGHSTGDSHTQTIKSHHNQVKEIQDLKAAGMLLEPIDDLFKDEVRELGRELGLPDELVERQPFPGPGLAIRILAAAKSDEQLQPLPEQTEIQAFAEELIAGSKVHLLPVQTVGVGGDERSHLSVAAVEYGGFDADQLARLGAELPARFRDSLNRVIYALQPGPLSGHSLTKTELTADVCSQLRHADRIVFEQMRAAGLLGTIKQFPVILLPLSFDRPGDRSIVLRPVITSTFMTVQAMLPGRGLPSKFLAAITGRILAEVPGISQVFVDLTNKPPATTEWE